MGQQQLLFIALAVIIVGIAVILGIQMVNARSASSNRDAISQDCLSVASIAKAYFGRPLAMGGGGNSFTGFTIPEKFKLGPNGNFSDPDVTDGGKTLTLTIEGKEISEDNNNRVKVKVTVNFQGDVTVTTIN